MLDATCLCNLGNLQGVLAMCCKLASTCGTQYKLLYPMLEYPMLLQARYCIKVDGQFTGPAATKGYVIKAYVVTVSGCMPVTIRTLFHLFLLVTLQDAWPMTLFAMASHEA